MNKLLRVLLVVAIVLAGFLAGYAVVNKYNDYKVSQKSAQLSRDAQARQALSDYSSVLSADHAATVKTYNHLRSQCLAGKAAWDALTPTQQTTVPAPVCGKPLK